MSQRPRVVFDCSIFWRAFFYPLGVGARCIDLVKEGNVFHFMSDETLLEVQEVLTRPETLIKFRKVTIAEVDSFINRIVERSTLVKQVPRVLKLRRDPKDEPYIDLAAVVSADFLVTADRDLLDLRTGIDIISKQFRQRFRHLKIVRPDEFLRIVHSRELPLDP